LATDIGVDRLSAQQLWLRDPRRALAGEHVDDPAGSPQADGALGARFDSWALCDACCVNLFDKTRSLREGRRLERRKRST